jgi:hypothetical protein
VSGSIGLGARLWTCADGLHRRHSKGRPGITPLAYSCQGKRCERTTETASAQLKLAVGHSEPTAQATGGTAFQARSRRAHRG